MKYEISAGALVVLNHAVLLVHHKKVGNYDFWVPPGGRLEGEESIFECAKREVFEETGLHIDVERIAYVEEFVAPGHHHSCKFWMLCKAFGGEITLANRDANEKGFLVDAKFMARDQLQPLNIYPSIMYDQFWSDLEDGFPCTRYLGLQRVKA